MDTTRHREYAAEQLSQAARRYTAACDMLNKLESVALPSEASIGLYDVYAPIYGAGQLTVHVALDSDLPYKERIRPVGQVLRTFACHSIHRSVDEYGSVSFFGTGQLPDGTEVSIDVRCDTGAISPACTVETVTETKMEQITKTRVVVTCPEPVRASV